MRPPVELADHQLVEDLFRRESGHLVAALTRLFGPSNLTLVEDVVQDALMAAMQAWQFEPPRDPKAWILQTARNRAIDVLRRERRRVSLPPGLDAEGELGVVASALSPAEETASELAMMFSICDGGLGQETHVTLILRWLCGLSPQEIARAFLVDTQTIDRRLHRGRARLAELGRLHDVEDADQMRAREPSVHQALYLLFSEGYHGSDSTHPLRPGLCADALRLAELLLLAGRSTDHVQAHALAALFCFDSARLPTRLDDDGIFLPLAEQDRARWDRSLIDRGVVHLAEAAAGERLGRWHLEAGIACEHAIAPSVDETDWARIVDLYDQLLGLNPSPVLALNRALAVAQLRGVEAGRAALVALAHEEKLVGYPFFWAARADIERRAGRPTEARPLYERAVSLSRSRAERRAYERRIEQLGV